VDTDVIVAGAGPVGLALAAELRLKGTNVVVVERLRQRGGQSKAMNLQPGTAETLSLRGLLHLAEERSMGHIGGVHFAGLPVSYDQLDTRYRFQVAVLQARVEEVLEERLLELGGDLRRGWDLSRFEQDGEGVTVHGSQTLRARYLVGCDGGRSTVRNALGVAFPGTDPTQYATIADIVLSAGTIEPPTSWTSMEAGGARKHGPNGSFASIIPIGEPGLYRFVYFDWRHDRDEVTTEEVASVLRSFYNDDYKLHEVRFASRFSDASRQVDQYRVERVFLAGDAAHVHMPAGGQGLNLGVQDAFNLGWKLAAVAAGRMPETLLDTYHTERHPVGAAVLLNTRAQSVLRVSDIEHTSLRQIFERLLAIPDVDRVIASMIAGFDIDYGGLGRTGTRLPDFRIDTRWASELFHTGQGVLLATDDEHLGLARPWADRVVARHVDELPWSDVEAVLVRPDGYLCWTAPSTPVTTALQAWFGDPGPHGHPERPPAQKRTTYS
jgi:2-polyprenyl-6-methoxyphenol hydroxylase-like FAD-dependent oxidoreductase